MAKKGWLKNKLSKILGLKQKFNQSLGGDDYDQESGNQKADVEDQYYQDLLGIKQMPEAGTLDNVEVRKWYLYYADKIAESIVKFRSLEEQAGQAYNLRKWLKVKARELMANREQAVQLEQTNPILTYEQVRQRQVKKGLAYWEHICEGIINSSTKSRDIVNKKLGLEPPVLKEIDPLWQPYLRLPSEYDVPLESKEQQEISDVKKHEIKQRKRQNTEMEI